MSIVHSIYLVRRASMRPEAWLILGFGVFRR